MYKMYAVLGLAEIKSKQFTCKSAKAYYVSDMIIFVATLATILLVTKLGAKPKQHPRHVRVKAKKNTIGSTFFKGTVVTLCPLPPSSLKCFCKSLYIS